MNVFLLCRYRFDQPHVDTAFQQTGKLEIRLLRYYFLKIARPNQGSECMSDRNDLKHINSSNCQSFQEIKAKCASSQLEFVVPGAGFELAKLHGKIWRVTLVYDPNRSAYVILIILCVDLYTITRECTMSLFILSLLVGYFFELL